MMLIRVLVAAAVGVLTLTNAVADDENVCSQYDVEGELICFLGQALEASVFQAELYAEQDALTNAAVTLQKYVSEQTAVPVSSIDRQHIEKMIKPQLVKQKSLVTDIGSSGKGFVQAVYSIDKDVYAELQTTLVDYVKGLGL